MSNFKRGERSVECDVGKDIRNSSFSGRKHKKYATEIINLI